MSGSLYLFPADPWAEPPERTSIVRALQSLELIDAPLDDHRFLAADGVFRHITFAGCSPHLSFTPPSDGSRNFCHVGLLGPYAQPRMITGPNTLKPRCPQCGQRVADWRPLAVQWEEDPERPWTCPGCGAQALLPQLRWRQHVAFGRLLVEIHSVFPGEAVPGERLLSRLGEAGGGTWDYGWSGSSGD